MCTSFVLHADQTYIGMNFDIADRPIQLSLKDCSQFVVQQKEASQFLPAFGINRAGAFMNLLTVAPHQAGTYRRGKNCVHIVKLLDTVLGENLDATALSSLLHGKMIVNVPNFSVHSLVTCTDRSAYVVEPGRQSLVFTPSEHKFVVLTNFPLSDFIDHAYTDVVGDGAERYKTCYRMLEASQHAFSIERGFAVLEATAQTQGDFPTQVSMLAVPEEERIYFAINRAYRKQFVFSFDTSVIQTYAGFAEKQEHNLEKKPILVSELVQW